MGIVNSRTRSAFSWRPVPLTMRRKKQTPTQYYWKEIEYEITKPVYDLLYKTSFVQQKILDELSKKYGEQFTMKREYETEFDDGLYEIINTYTSKSPADLNQVNIMEMMLADHHRNRRGKQEFFVRLSGHRDSLDFMTNARILDSAFKDAKATYEAHVSERNSLVALALTGKDDTRRGEALEIFARNYYPDSIRAASGARVDVDSSSIPALAREYSQALRSQALRNP